MFASMGRSDAVLLTCLAAQNLPTRTAPRVQTICASWRCWPNADVFNETCTQTVQIQLTISAISENLPPHEVGKFRPLTYTSPPTANINH